jgi:hypothetical protein|tara:strand:- start:19 stop:408 length:390 start_codon:yes stop_codon:yes gene_type:complete
MQFLLFVVALAVVVGIIGFGAWAFARSFVYLSQQTHRGIVFAVNRVFVPTFHSLNAAVENFKAMRLAKAQSTARSEEAVIEQPASSFESVKTEEVEQSPTQMPKRDESEVDWSVYDIPTYLRKGKVLVW